MISVLAIFLLFTFSLALPPAVSVIAVSATVYAVMQAAKQSPWLAQNMKGWVAVTVNIVLTVTGITMSAQPGQLWTQGTLQAILIAVLMSSGIHGTVTKVVMKNSSSSNPLAK